VQGDLGATIAAFQAAMKQRVKIKRKTKRSPGIDSNESILGEPVR
jgi:hypothetical protein